MLDLASFSARDSQDANIASLDMAVEKGSEGAKPVDDRHNGTEGSVPEGR